MTALLSIVHQPNAGPGVFADGLGDVVEWMPSEGPPPPLDGLSAAMVFGGAMHVDQHSTHPWLGGEKQLIRELLDRGVPVLGVCLGAQLLAEAAGAQPRRASQPEIGWHRVEVTPEGARDPLIGPLATGFEVFLWHSYEARLPPGGVALARTPLCLQAFRLGEARAWAFSFTPRSRWPASRRGSTAGRRTRRPRPPASTRRRSAGRAGGRSPPRRSWDAGSRAASWPRRGA